MQSAVLQIYIYYLAKSKNDTNAAEYPQKTPLSRRVKVVSFFFVKSSYLISQRIVAICL